jgi:hypothetical protein
VEAVNREDRHDARTVEIALALALGALVLLVPAAGVYLLGWVLGFSGVGWESTRRAVLIVAAALGGSATVWWLVRARRRAL